MRNLGHLTETCVLLSEASQLELINVVEEQKSVLKEIRHPRKTFVLRSESQLRFIGRD